MEIRNFKLLNADNLVATFDIYIPEWKLTLSASLRKTKTGAEFISEFSRSFEENGERVWKKGWEFSKEAGERFFIKVKELVKEQIRTTPSVFSS